MEIERVGIFEAKTHFSEIVERVLRDGRTVVVNRRGLPVVEISPIRERSEKTRMSWPEALTALDRLRRAIAATFWADITSIGAPLRRVRRAGRATAALVA